MYYVPIEDSTQGSLHPAVHIIHTRRLYTLFRVSFSVFIYFSFPAVDSRFVIAVTSVTVSMNKKTAVAGGMISPGYSYLLIFFFFYISQCDEKPPIEMLLSLSILKRVCTCAHVRMCNHVWSSPPHEHLFSST